MPSIHGLTVIEYCQKLGWTITDLSRQADINPRTAKNAYEGEQVAARPQKQIAAAFSRALNAQINVGDIFWAKPETAQVRREQKS